MTIWKWSIGVERGGDGDHGGGGDDHDVPGDDHVDQVKMEKTNSGTDIEEEVVEDVKDTSEGAGGVMHDEAHGDPGQKG